MAGIKGKLKPLPKGRMKTRKEVKKGKNYAFVD
jgi:hypothetical protein